MIYESIKRRVSASLGGTAVPALVFFTIGAISKAVATTLTYPLQLVQAKLRVNIDDEYVKNRNRDFYF